MFASLPAARFSDLSLAKKIYALTCTIVVGPDCTASSRLAGAGVLVSSAGVVVSSADVVVLTSAGAGDVSSAVKGVDVSCTGVVSSAAVVVFHSAGTGVVVSSAAAVVVASAAAVVSTAATRSVNVSTWISLADVSRCSSSTNAPTAASISAAVKSPVTANTPVRCRLSGNSATHAPFRRYCPAGQKHSELFTGDTRPCRHATHLPDTPKKFRAHTHAALPFPDVSFLAHGTHAAGPVPFLNVSAAHAVQLPPAPVLPAPHTQPGMSTPGTHASG
jgi:hypothetical protein